MTIDDKIRDEKLSYHINRVISVLSSAKLDEYEYLTEEEILLPNQSQLVEQDTFTQSPLGKALESQAEKQVDALKSLNLSVKQMN